MTCLQLKLAAAVLVLHLCAELLNGKLIAINVSNRLAIICFYIGQECFEAPGRTLFQLGNTDETLPRTQAIVRSYVFHCCGNITGWQARFDKRCGQCHENFHFQVWRPSLNVSADGCHSLVGEDIENGTRTEGIRSFILINKTLQSTDFIPVEPGDVLGFYTPRRSSRILLNRNYQNASVWYTRIDDDEYEDRILATCPFPVGRDRRLLSFTSAAPVFSVIMSKCIHTTQTSRIFSIAKLPT